MKISDAQKIRAARALLNWRQKTLSEKSGVSTNTIVKMEQDGHRAIASNRAMVFRALLTAGVDFNDYGVFINPTPGALVQSAIASEKGVAQAESVGAATEAGGLVDAGTETQAPPPSPTHEETREEKFEREMGPGHTMVEADPNTYP